MDIFNRYYRRYDRWFDRNKFAYLSELEAVRKVLPKKGKGLEIGVGTGRFAAPLGIKFGIDPSGNMLKIAKRRNINARFGTGESLPFKKASFDYIAIIVSICFVKDPRKVLKEIRRVLKKNGKVIIGIIDRDSFLGKFYRKRKNIFYKQAYFFNVKEINGLLKASGFGRVSYYQTMFKSPDEMDSVEKPLKSFGKGAFVVIGARKT